MYTDRIDSSIQWLRILNEHINAMIYRNLWCFTDDMKFLMKLWFVVFWDVWTISPSKCIFHLMAWKNPFNTWEIFETLKNKKICNFSSSNIKSHFLEFLRFKLFLRYFSSFTMFLKINTRDSHTQSLNNCTVSKKISIENKKFNLLWYGTCRKKNIIDLFLLRCLVVYFWSFPNLNRLILYF